MIWNLPFKVYGLNKGFQNIGVFNAMETEANYMSAYFF